MDTSTPFSVPRLRLPRHSSPQYQDQALTPVASSSRNPDFLHADDDDEDAESTPRMPTSVITDKNSPRTTSSLPLAADNPTARLRALLARVPNSPNGNTHHASASRPLTLPSSSEPDSDFEPPHSTVSTASFARESLKELFSHALREPGNTPRKAGRPRRNSIDTSEVEASPRVEEERAQYKAKRRTFSDEETEKSRISEASEPSTRSSAASAFDALRQRLNRSNSAMPSPPKHQMVMDMSLPPLNSSTDTAMPPVMATDTPSDTPPRATSTPMRTFQMSAHLDMNSNLLDQDSEMQNALQGMDSYESAAVPRHRHSSTPSLKSSTGPTPRPQPNGHSSTRPLSWSSHSKSHSVHNLPQPPRRTSEELISSTPSSRASSSLSSIDYHERVDETQRERIHERERGWNSPVPRPPKSPAHPGKHDASHRHSWGSPGNGRASPAHALSRKGSAASLASTASTDDGRPSSRASSVASRSEYKERVRELEEDRNKEREREWNKPHHKLSRSSSSLSLNKSDRVRTTSTPSRPDSATSYLSPVTNTLRRHGSSNSLSSSRPSSPNGSISGHDVEVEIEHEVEHQRERNWNSPRPDWGNHLLHRRSLSPLPRSRPSSPTDTPPQKLSTTPRSRANSVTHSNSLSVPTSIPRSKSPVGERVPRPRSPMLHNSANKSSSSSHSQSKTSVPHTPSAEKADSSQPAYVSRFGWHFPNHKALPPLELDQESPSRPHSRPSSRNSLSAATTTPSHIPVYSPRKAGHGSTASVSAPSDKKKSHRRSVTEFAESIGGIPPRIEVSVSEDLPPVPIVGDVQDELSSASEDESKAIRSTPTARPVSLPPEISTTPAFESSADAHDDSMLQSPVRQQRPESPLVSPPLTPPAADSQPMFTLQTPPRRPQFHTPKTEFQTPPPPANMPELPGPPSDSEDDGEHTPLMLTPEVPQGDLTSLKTPRPPGAWLATPAPTRQSIKEAPERAVSAPPPDFGSPSTSSDSGLATPPSTLSRATSLPPQTPAPPGGWVATPAAGPSARRRGSLLKVRFDLDPETASEGVAEKPSADASLESKDSVPELKNALQNGDVSGSSSAQFESSAEAPPTPPSLRDRIRKKSPGIRILDAYGREQVETEPAVVVEPDTHSEHVEVQPPEPWSMVSSTPRKEVRSTPRNRSAVRVVDAMGREIEEEPVKEESSILSTTPLSHREALTRMRDTLTHMRQELSDADRSSDDAAFDTRMYAALEEQCKASQVARTQLSKTLQVAQSTESKGKYFWNKASKSSRLLSGDADIRLSWNIRSWRFIACFILVQLFLLAIMYRYSLVQARKIFLTTYYDSFYPELYIYLLKPDTTKHTIPSCPSWSIFTIANGLQHAGWRGVIADTWASASCAVTSFFQSTWVGWHYTQDTVPFSWPPT